MRRDGPTAWQSRALELVGLVAFVALYYLVEDGANSWVLGANLACFYILFFRAILSPDRILPQLPSYLTVEILFYVFSYIIFFYPYQSYLLGRADVYSTRFFANSFGDTSNKAITLATIGMLAFALGYRLLQSVHADIGSERNPTERDDATVHYVAAMTLSATVLLVFAIGIYLMTGARAEGEGRYTGTTTQSLGIEGLYTLILMLTMVLAALWIYSAANDLPRSILLIVGLFTAISWNVRLLILGDRSSFLLFAIVFAAGYFTFVRRASLLTIVAAFGIWILAYNFIEVLRMTPDWYETGNIFNTVENSRAYRLSQMESTFNVTTITVRASVATVPSLHDYMYGTFKLIELSNAIPFSGKLFLPYLRPEYLGSSAMLTDVLVGPRPAWSVGTNILSDSYLDFGIPGVIAILFMVGFAAKAVRNYVAIDPTDAHRIVMYLLTIALLAELPRYGVDLPVRTLAWAFALSIVVRAYVRRASSGGAPQGQSRPNTRPIGRAG